MCIGIDGNMETPHREALLVEDGRGCPSGVIGDDVRKLIAGLLECRECPSSVDKFWGSSKARASSVHGACMRAMGVQGRQ